MQVGLITAYQIDNVEGVNYANEMIVVGYNSATAHYVGFRSTNFNRFLQVEQELSAEFRKISCFNAPTIISNDDDIDMSRGNLPRNMTYDNDHDDDDGTDDVNMCGESMFSNFDTTFPSEEAEYVCHEHPQPPPYSSMDFSNSPLLSDDDNNITDPVSAPVYDSENFCSFGLELKLSKLSKD